MKCEECGVDHETVRKNFRTHLYSTAYGLCGYKDLDYEFHGSVTRWAENNIRSGNRSLMVLLPRGHFKTSIMTIAMCVWLLINNPETRILVIQSSNKKAMKLIFAIRAILESVKFQHYFPEMVPKSKDRWNANELQVERAGIYPEASVTARGLSSRIVGDHYDVIIEDDPIDLEDVDSEITMEDAITWQKNMGPLFVRIGRGLNIVIGTRWSESDLYGWIKATQPSYKILEAGCYADERTEGWLKCEPGEKIWPAFDDVAAKEIVNDEWVWSHQYLNIALSDELRRFKETDIQFYNWLLPTVEIKYGERNVLVERLYRVLTCDPSVGETKDSDESAIVVSGIDRRTGDIFILDVWSGRVVAPDLINRIVEMAKDWKVHILGIEDVGFQKTLKYPLRQAMQWKNAFFPITALKSEGKKKAKRIDSLAPYFANKQVWMLRNQEKLRKQLLSFHPSMRGLDDIVDALAYHPRFWRSNASTVNLVPGVPEDEDVEPRNIPPLYGLKVEAL